MADEKQYQEDTTTANSLTQHASAGLHHDHIAQEAIGGHTADLGKGYFTSMNFIGTVIVSQGHSAFAVHLVTTQRRHVLLKYLDILAGCCLPTHSP
jgi:hypothetical protein